MELVVGSNHGFSLKPARTRAYIGKVKHLLECRCNAQRAENWLKPSAVMEVNFMVHSTKEQVLWIGSGRVGLSLPTSILI